MEWSLNSIPKVTGMIKQFQVFEILILWFFCLACSNNKVKDDLQFYYYPEKNVYYESAKRTFFYSLDGTRSWAKYKSASSTEPGTLGDKVLIHSLDSNVYNENEKHRKLYAGRLYAINMSNTVTAITSAEVVERNIAVSKRKLEVKKRVANKPKSGIGKFINKIFGKKK
jgi:hypothetical protein